MQRGAKNRITIGQNTMCMAYSLVYPLIDFVEDDVAGEIEQGRLGRAVVAAAGDLLHGAAGRVASWVEVQIEVGVRAGLGWTGIRGKTMDHGTLRGFV